jgi:hypothetical protein
MEMNIGITNVDDSNDFLRCLWAEMAIEFGKCGWQYAPYKDGAKNKITFGWMDINQESPLEVGITYIEKGSINNIFFKLNYGKDEINKGTELYQGLKRVVNTAKQNVGQLETKYFRTVIQSYYPLMSYRTDTYTIEPMNNGITQLSFGIKAYDKNQARGYITQKATQLMNFLSVETNSVFNLPTVDDEGVIKVGKEIFQETDFIDGHSVKDDFFVISEEGKQFIKILTDTESLSPEIELFLNACSHFHSARKQEESMLHTDPSGMTVRHLGGDETELATTLYLSALEVVTLIGFKEDKCETCGQPKFQITKRVKELTAKYLPNHLVKDFIDYYDKRSKYLHVGIRLNTETPTRSFIPLLDPSDNRGCDSPSKVSTINIREYVSYCLRNFYRENLL